MTNKTLDAILNHLDKDEIISKLIIGIPTKDIHEWLNEKYATVNKKYVISEKTLKTFQSQYLDIYQHIKQDIEKVQTGSAQLSIQNNSTYKKTIQQLANSELDIKTMLINAVNGIELRLSQLFENIQNAPDNIKADRILIEWFDTLGNMIERYNKLIINPPDQVIQHNITFQAVDQHISVFQEVIREVISKMDIETSLLFMEIYQEKMSKLKNPTEIIQQKATSERALEAKLLTEQIGEKLND